MNIHSSLICGWLKNKENLGLIICICLLALLGITSLLLSYDKTQTPNRLTVCTETTDHADIKSQTMTFHWEESGGVLNERYLARIDYELLFYSEKLAEDYAEELAKASGKSRLNQSGALLTYSEAPDAQMQNMTYTQVQEMLREHLGNDVSFCNEKNIGGG